MCGRYTQTKTEGLDLRFNAQNQIKDLRPNYNVSPGQIMPVVTRNSPNKLELMQWGLLPVFAESPEYASKYKTHNAKAETLTERPTYRGSVKSKRCLVPCTGYYEWKKEGDTKTPYIFKVKDEEVFALAGLYNIWHDKEGNELATYTIITTEPNAIAAQVHDRMPVILNKEDEDKWLNSTSELSVITSLLKPYESEKMESYPVSKEVGNSKNNAPSLSQPLNSK